MVDVCEQIPSFNVMPVYGLNCYSLVKYHTVILSRAALDLLESRILTHFYRAKSLQKKYRYADFKRLILCEGEDEEDPVHAPYV